MYHQLVGISIRYAEIHCTSYLCAMRYNTYHSYRLQLCEQRKSAQ